jgi:hypothetical protein
VSLGRLVLSVIRRLIRPKTLHAFEVETSKSGLYLDPSVLGVKLEVILPFQTLLGLFHLPQTLKNKFDTDRRTYF